MQRGPAGRGRGRALALLSAGPLLSCDVDVSLHSMMLRGPRVNRSACGISESVPLSFYGLGFFDSSLLPLRCIDGIGLSPDLRSQDLPPISRSPPRPCSSLCTVLSSCAYCARECHLLMYVRASVTRWSILASRPYVRASVNWLVYSCNKWADCHSLVYSCNKRADCHSLVYSCNKLADCHWLVYSCNRWADCHSLVYSYSCNK